MPRSQVACVANYDFGAPATEGVVLKFRTRKAFGGKLQIKFEAYEDDIEVTLQVSPDDSAWTDTSAADNLAAIANEAVPARESREFTINVRQGEDLFLRLQAVGPGRGQMQVRQDALLEISVI